MDYKINIINEHIFILRDSGSKYEINLEEKLLQFALQTIKLISIIPYKREFDVFRNQLSKSATSIGANYQESQAASYAEFRQRIQICLRESRETVYWIKLLKELFRNQSPINEKIQEILNESIELKNIFGTIYNKVRKKS